MAKRYFADNSIPYTEVDVQNDRDGLREMLAMTGGHRVPVLMVGTRAMVGWDRDEFDRLYGMPPDPGPKAPKR